MNLGGEEMIQAIVHIALVVRDYDEAINKRNDYFTCKGFQARAGAIHWGSGRRKGVFVLRHGRFQQGFSRDEEPRYRICQGAQVARIWNGCGIQGFVWKPVGSGSVQQWSPYVGSSQII